jgi:hypothetical protein
MAKAKARVQLTGTTAFQAREEITRSNVIAVTKRGSGMKSKRRQKLWEKNRRKGATEPIPRQRKDRRVRKDHVQAPSTERDEPTDEYRHQSGSGQRNRDGWVWVLSTTPTRTRRNR